MMEVRYDDIFEAVRVRENIWQILGQGGELCYLLTGSDRAILIDQTTPNMIQRISRMFERNPLISKEI